MDANLSNCLIKTKHEFRNRIGPKQTHFILVSLECAYAAVIEFQERND